VAVNRPALILDVGSGTGQWAYDLCAEFPKAVVIGLDLEPSKPGAPASYRSVRANLLNGLPFVDGGIDYVHQRFMFAAVPVRSWPGVVADLVRVARPGGWVELTEGATELVPAGPATERLTEMLRRLSRTRGLDSTAMVFGSLDNYLRRAGATEVTRRTVALPLGDWGGRVGSLMACDFRALFTRLSPAFMSAFGVPEAECWVLVRSALEECDQQQSTYSVAVAYGRRPHAVA